MISPDIATLVRTLGWRPRSETPPAGPLWASDGTAMWPLCHDGGPLPPRVQYWQPSELPLRPPAPRPGATP